MRWARSTANCSWPWSFSPGRLCAAGSKSAIVLGKRSCRSSGKLAKASPRRMRFGIVHRDFKPDNVMFGDDERVRVTDFGLARFQGKIVRTRSPAQREVPAQIQVNELTRTGALLGTPGYMACEQLEGKPADARSDQFGFCVTLYEALYGERPFTGISVGELVLNVTEGRIRQPPSGSAVPTWLRKAVVRGLAKSPDERWPSMRALLDALADDPAARHRRWGAGAMLVGLLGGGAWGVTYAAQREEQVCAGMQENLDGTWDATRRAELKAAIEGTQLSYAESTWERVEQRLDDYTGAWVAARTQACEATHQGEQSGEHLGLAHGVPGRTALARARDRGRVGQRGRDGGAGSGAGGDGLAEPGSLRGRGRAQGRDSPT